MADDDEYGVPEGALVLNQLHIVEYIDTDGELYKMDLSYSRDGGDLSSGKYFELCEWARMMAAAPLLADMVRDHVYYEEDEEGNE